MRPTNEIECDVPWCNATIYSDDYKLHVETGVCSTHTVCVKCHKSSLAVKEATPDE